MRQSHYFLHNIKYDRYRVADASENNKDVEDRVKISGILAEEEHPSRIKQASEKYPEKSAVAQAEICLLHRKDYRPAHTDIAYHTERSVFSEINSRQHSGYYGKSPYKTEGHPRG